MIIFYVILSNLCVSAFAVTISLDGGYSDVIVRIDGSIPTVNCSDRLRNLKTILSNSSSSLLTSLSGRAYFHSFIIIVPHTWDEDLCQFTEDRDSAVAATRAADIVIDEHDGDPYVEHSRGCGYPGDGIFLSVDSLDWLDSTALVSAWIEYRYGVIRSAGCRPVHHPDFTGVVTDNEPHRASMADIRVVRQPLARYVLAIETTASMMVGDAWKWVNKAAQKLIRYDLPASSSLAVVSYNNASKVEHPMERVDGPARERMADTVPGKYQLAGHDVRCVVCLFQNILHQVLKGDTAGAHIILLTRGDQHSASLTDQQIISEYVHQYGIKVSTIIIPTSNHLPFYDKIAQTSGGQSFLVRSSPEPMDVYFPIVTSMQRILWPDSSSSALKTETIHHQEHFTSRNTTEGTFYIDKYLGKNTVFGIYVADPEDHLIKSVTFQDEDGTLYGPYNKMSASYDLINFKTPNIVGEQPFGSAAGRRWKYRVEWFASSKKMAKTILSVTSGVDPGEEQLVVSSWVAGIGWCDAFQHVRVLARIRRGNRRVVGARSVIASIEVEMENGTVISLPPLEMVDDGEGDTDMVHGDGIYSATILEYPVTGRYSLTIHVDEAEEATAAKTAPGPVFHLSSLPEEDCVPPARVRDLEITVTGGNRSILATWTSPGGDLDQGSVDRFTVVYSVDVSDLLDEAAEAKVLATLDRQAVAGDSLVQEIEFPFSNQLWHIGLYARDGEGNRGRMSNIQQVFIPEPVTSAPVQVHRLGQIPSTSSDWFIIIIISSALGGILMLSLLCVIFIFATSKKQKTPSTTSEYSCYSTEAKESPDFSIFQSDSSSCCETPSTPPSMQGVTDLQQILAGQRAAWPVYWSAEQILGRAESESSYEQEDSYQVFGPPPSPGGRIVTPGVDEGSDDGSRELEIIHKNILHTIV